MQSTLYSRIRLAWFRRFLINRSRPQKHLITVVFDLVGVFSCVLIGAWLSALTIPFASVVLLGALSSAAVVVSAHFAGLYRSVVRFIGLDLVLSAVMLSLAPAMLGAVYLWSMATPAETLRWFFVFLAFLSIFIVGSRYVATAFLVGGRGARREEVIVYGAGAAGAMLIDALRSERRFRPVAILDDAEALHGTRVKGLDVFPSESVKFLMNRFGATRVFLALPSASRRRRRKILVRLADAQVRVQTIPEIHEILSGKASVAEISDIEATEILGREPVPPNDELLGASITGKAVLVTGGGGSIGSELCRQIIRLSPKRLVILELSEPALYSIDRGLQDLQRKTDGSVEIVPLLGSVLDQKRLTETISAFEVDTVFHAAAYKHVPIVEHNILQGIENNVLGTLRAAVAASDGGAKDFVLVSTDKAVNPTTVMGATKRCAELTLQAMNETSKTTMSIVRFGNVLASSGSVVPLFKKQIRAGGPVTVTHRDITRYFMTIPEAAQLVIQAGAMARGGDVFVLDMGKPVKIVDLAKRMIHLMGLAVRDSANPHGDIEINFVGLRPAEKLYEELLIGGSVTGTEHPRILRANEVFLPWSKIAGIVEELEAAVEGLDCERAFNLLLSSIEEYQPEHDVHDLVWAQKRAVNAEMSDSRIVEFPKSPPQ